MNPIVNTEKLEAEAAAWLIRSEAAGFTAQDSAALEKWLAESPRHRAIYMRLQAAWKQADQLRRLRPFDGAVDKDLMTESILPSLQGRNDAQRNLRSPFGGRKVRQYAYGVIGAVFALLALSFAARELLERFRWQTYVTDIGGFERIVLRDGSVVHMNTNSRIRVHYTRARREVLLERGEALFTVAKNPQRPFDVEAQGSVIHAAGTVFTVRLRDARAIEVLVTEGQVIIDRAKQAVKSASAPLQPSSALSAGEMVTIGAGALHIAKIDSTQVARKTAWMQGQLLFEQQTLRDMVAEFNRYNRRQLVVVDPAIADLRMSAGFDATDTGSFVAALERMFRVRVVGVETNGSSVESLRLGGPAYPQK
jgi:transmembrane sensor